MTEYVPPLTDEPEILDASRAFAEAQARLRGPVDASRGSVEALVGWYGNDVVYVVVNP